MEFKSEAEIIEVPINKTEDPFIALIIKITKLVREEFDSYLDKNQLTYRQCFESLTMITANIFINLVDYFTDNISLDKFSLAIDESLNKFIVSIQHWRELSNKDITNMEMN